ncbi:ATP-binding cassette transporter, partial [Clonorchis sinensis]
MIYAEPIIEYPSGEMSDHIWLLKHMDAYIDVIVAAFPLASTYDPRVKGARSVEYNPKYVSVHSLLMIDQAVVDPFAELGNLLKKRFITNRRMRSESTFDSTAIVLMPQLNSAVVIPPKTQSKRVVQARLMERVSENVRSRVGREQLRVRYQTRRVLPICKLKSHRDLRVISYTELYDSHMMVSDLPQQPNPSGQHQCVEISELVYINLSLTFTWPPSDASSVNETSLTGMEFVLKATAFEYFSNTGAVLGAMLVNHRLPCRRKSTSPDSTYKSFNKDIETSECQCKLMTLDSFLRSLRTPNIVNRNRNAKPPEDSTELTAVPASMPSAEKDSPVGDTITLLRTSPSSRTDRFARPASHLAADSVPPSSATSLNTSKSVFKPRKPVYLATFNVRSLKQAGQQVALARTLDSLRIDVCCLSETRTQDASTVIELTAPSLSSRFRLRTSGDAEAASVRESRGRVRKTRTPRLAIEKLVDPEVKRNYQNQLVECLPDGTVSDINGHWEKISKALLKVGTSVCGTTQPTSFKHWISDRTVSLLETRRQIPPGRHHNSTRRIIRRQVKLSVRADREAWWTRKAQEMEDAKNAGNVRRLFHLIRSTGPRKPLVSETIRDQNGSLICNKAERLDRWAQYFEQQFSWPPATSNQETWPSTESWTPAQKPHYAQKCTPQPNHLKHDVRYGTVQKPKYASVMLAKHRHTQFDSTPATNPFLLFNVPSHPLGRDEFGQFIQKHLRLLLFEYENDVCILHIDKVSSDIWKPGSRRHYYNDNPKRLTKMLLYGAVQGLKYGVAMTWILVQDKWSTWTTKVQTKGQTGSHVGQSHVHKVGHKWPDDLKAKMGEVLISKCNTKEKVKKAALPQISHRHQGDITRGHWQPLKYEFRAHALSIVTNRRYCPQPSITRSLVLNVNGNSPLPFEGAEPSASKRVLYCLLE